MAEFLSESDEALNDFLYACGFHRVATESTGGGVTEYTYFNDKQVMVKINYAFAASKPTGE
jgi:hypothetical protein